MRFTLTVELKNPWDRRTPGTRTGNANRCDETVNRTKSFPFPGLFRPQLELVGGGQ